jgi:hypothetical protein
MHRSKTRWSSARSWVGGYHDPRKLPADLLAEFDEVAHRPGYKRIARKVLAGWRSWSKARDYYRQISAPVTSFMAIAIGLGRMNANAHGR